MFRHIAVVWLLIIGGCLGCLTGFVLLFLKLAGHFDWGWIWVTLPFGVFLVTSLIVAVFFIFGFPSSEEAAAWQDKADELASPD